MEEIRTHINDLDSYLHIIIFYDNIVVIVYEHFHFLFEVGYLKIS